MENPQYRPIPKEAEQNNTDTVQSDITPASVENQHDQENTLIVPTGDELLELGVITDIQVPNIDATIPGLTDTNTDTPRSVKKTKRMLQIEMETGLSIDYLLTTMYAHQDMTAKEISQVLDIGESTVIQWLHRFHFQVRDISNRPAKWEKNRLAAFKQTWADRKAEIVAKIYTPESNAKRNKTRAKWHKDNPEKSAEITRYMQSQRETKGRERLTTAFGSNIREGLIWKHHVQALTIVEIGEQTGYTSVFIGSLLQENDVQHIPKTNTNTIKTYADFQRLLWQKPEAISSLTPDQKMVIRLRFLGNEEDQVPTLQEVADQIGKSKQRVDQIEKAALKKLQIAVEEDVSS